MYINYPYGSAPLQEYIKELYPAGGYKEKG